MNLKTEFSHRIDDIHIYKVLDSTGRQIGTAIPYPDIVILKLQNGTRIEAGSMPAALEHAAAAIERAAAVDLGRRRSIAYGELSSAIHEAHEREAHPEDITVRLITMSSDIGALERSTPHDKPRNIEAEIRIVTQAARDLDRL